ncbi:MAG: guanylate kinase [Victivallales bacterium]|nr:guanylate kinase [Victivallales bacterium]
MEKLGTIIVLSGPSGVGKSTLIKQICAVMPELQFSISCTTRPPRPGERHGIHYYFLSPEEFACRADRGEFVEHAQVFANRYGTLKSEVIERIHQGNSVILDIDVQGALQIRQTIEEDPELKNSTVFVFIAPPSIKALETRLRSRASDSEEQIALRLKNARRELSFWRSYDYLVINDDLTKATTQMTELFHSFALRTILLPEDLFYEA